MRTSNAQAIAHAAAEQFRVSLLGMLKSAKSVEDLENITLADAIPALNDESTAQYNRRKTDKKVAERTAKQKAPKKVSKAEEEGRETRNGITQPAIGGQIEKHWTLLDKLEANGVELNLPTVRKLAKRHRISENGLVQEFYRWKRFHATPETSVKKETSKKAATK